jgi:hypothetical protein
MYFCCSFLSDIQYWKEIFQFEGTVNKTNISVEWFMTCQTVEESGNGVKKATKYKKQVETTNPLAR